MSDQNSSTGKLIIAPLSIAIMGSILSGCSGLPKSTPSDPKVTYRDPVLVTPNDGSDIFDKVGSGNPKNFGTPNNNNGALLDKNNFPLEFLEATDMEMLENDRNDINQVGNLWDRVRSGYGFVRTNSYNPRIEQQKTFFISDRGRKFLTNTVARASRYLHYTVSEAEANNLPAELALLPIIESSYDPTRQSPANAVGLWQIMKGTAGDLNLNMSSSYDGRQDVIDSTRAAYQYLNQQYNRFGSWELALAAYNAGPQTVQNAINNNKRNNQRTDFWSLDLPAETMNYVPRLLAVAEIIASPKSYNFDLPAIANKQHFQIIEVQDGLTLESVASMTGTSLEELKFLNPALKTGRIDGNTPHRLLLPNSLSRDQLAAIQHSKGNIAGNMNSQPSPAPSHATETGSYIIRQGDSLASIAEQIGVTTAELAQWNHMSPSTPLQPGMSLKLYNPQNFNNNSNPELVRTVRQPVSSASPVQQRRDYYIVEVGDSLGYVAQKFGLSISKLASYNNLTTNSHLFIGQKIWLIPGMVKQAPIKTSQPRPSKISVPKLGPVKAKSSYNGDISKYKVRSGDTLSGIASKLNTTRSIIASLNSFNANHHVQRGQYIKVPADKITVDLKLYKKSTKYKVRNGESLNSISNKFGISIAELASANGLSRNSQLLRNSTITIPADTMKQVSSSQHEKTQGTAPKSQTVNIKTIDYKVKSGDSLTKLARKYETDISTLAKLNNISVNAGLQRGKIIKLPKTTEAYRVKSGDSLIRLARRYNIPTEKLAEMNNFSSTTLLQKGQTIKVPVK